jgi:adenylate cyclase
MTTPEVTAIAAWLIDGARSAPRAEDVLAELCSRLVASGIELWRVAVFVRTLHPQVMGRRFLRRPDSGVTVIEAPFETLETAEFRDSPVAHVYASGSALRRRLVDDAAADLPMLREFRAEEVTDYLAVPLVFTDNAIHVATWTTRRPGGFSEGEIAALELIVAPLARVAEIRAFRRTTATLLDTYVGRQGGARILAGHIRRGDTEAIRAAIWLSDMRGFTARADRMKPQQLIDLLNRYFDCQVPAIEEHGGEVLKFIGDGLLAIFPLGGKGAEEADAVCRHALAAARAARDMVAALADTPEVTAEGGLRFGLALHLGEVLYGNIGGGNRLDFTCIGPAVNLAARIEKLTGTLGRVILASDSFARHCRPDMLAIGEFALAGFSTAQTVFGLGDEGAPG